MSKMIAFKRGRSSNPRSGWDVAGYTFACTDTVGEIRTGKEGYFVNAQGVLTDNVADQRKWPVGRAFRVYISGPEDFDVIEDGRVICRSPTAGDSTPSFAFSDSDLATDPVEDTAETDEEIKARIEERFKMLQKLAMSAAQGIIQGMVVYGAPGIGKSWGVEKGLEDQAVLARLAWDINDPRRQQFDSDGVMVYKPKHRVVKGHVSAPALYGLLYEYSDEGEILIFDDCDGVLQDEQALNLLKSATDSSSKRTLNWITKRPNDEIPSSFEFKGSVIFITNVNFEKVVERGKSKIAPHLEAMLSRSYYLDLTIDTMREKLLRIEQVAKDFHMLTNMGLNDEQADEVMEYIKVNQHNFREVSVRTAIKVGKIRRSYCDDEWRACADAACLKNMNKRSRRF